MKLPIVTIDLQAYGTGRMGFFNTSVMCTRSMWYVRVYLLIFCDDYAHWHAHKAVLLLT